MLHHAVTHLDPDIYTEVEANYSSHLEKIPWDALSQTCALQKLLVVSRQAKIKVCGMHYLSVCQTTQALLINSTALVGSVEGFTTATDTSDAATSSAASTITGGLFYLFNDTWCL